MKLNYRILSDVLFYSSFDDLDSLIYTKLLFNSITLYDIYLSEKRNVLDILKNNKNINSSLQQDEELIFTLVNNFTLNKRLKTHKYFDFVSKIFFNYKTDKISKYYTPNTKFINNNYILEYFTIGISNVSKEKINELQSDPGKCNDFLYKLKTLFGFNRFELDYTFYKSTYDVYEINFEPNLNIKFDDLTNSIYIYFGFQIFVNNNPYALDDPFNMVKDFSNKLKEIRKTDNFNNEDLVRIEVLNKLVYPKLNYKRYKKYIKNRISIFNKIQKSLNKK